MPSFLIDLKSKTILEKIFYTQIRQTIVFTITELISDSLWESTQFYLPRVPGIFINILSFSDVARRNVNKHTGPNEFTSISSSTLSFLWLTAGPSIETEDGAAFR